MEEMLFTPPVEINFKFIPTHFHLMKPDKTEEKMQI